MAILCGGGCSGKKAKETGNVSGKITIAGESLPPGGEVSFISRDGIGGSSRVNDGGLYSISKIPVGSYKVVIVPPPLAHPHENKRGQGRGPGAEKYPLKYQADVTSDLAHEIKKGDQQKDFDLTADRPSAGNKRVAR